MWPKPQKVAKTPKSRKSHGGRKYPEGILNSPPRKKKTAKIVEIHEIDYPPDLGVFLQKSPRSWHDLKWLSLTAILSASSLCPFPLLNSVKFPTNLGYFLR
jgi:hypothetical protein